MVKQKLVSHPKTDKTALQAKDNTPHHNTNTKTTVSYSSGPSNSRKKLAGNCKVSEQKVGIKCQNRFQVLAI